MRATPATTFVFTLSFGALAAAAQSIAVNPGGTQVFDQNITIHAPAPIQVGRELAMSELALQQLPARFYLTFGTSGRAGPFALADGATVGQGPNACTLRLTETGRTFLLRPVANTNAAYGPFATTNGATVLMGQSVLTLRRVPPEITVSLSHPDRIAQTPMIGIAPLNRPVLQELYNLRAKYVALANRVDRDTADAEIEGVPRVSNTLTGSRFTPVVKTSQRDKQNAYKGAELSAVAFLEKLFAQAFSIRSQAITDGLTFHFSPPAAGDYVLCATQRVKDPNARAAATVTAVWWTAFHFDGEHPLALALTADNAITWREVFAFDQKR